MFANIVADIDDTDTKNHWLHHNGTNFLKDATNYFQFDKHNEYAWKYLLGTLLLPNEVVISCEEEICKYTLLWAKFCTCITANWFPRKYTDLAYKR